MLLTIITIVVVSAALIIGALWGIYGNLGDKTEGFLVGVAGGALLVSVILELMKPSVEKSPLGWCLAFTALGGIVFSVLDYLVKEKWGSGKGSGLLAAVTLDGIPENLAMGVALIGAGPLSVAALCGSIFLSNLPEAAGGAKEMKAGNLSKKKVLWLWIGTALLLSVCAILGNLLLENVSDAILSYIRCFAAGAVVASLAIEVFPKAFKKDNYWAGLSAILGLVIAYYLNSLG